MTLIRMFVNGQAMTGGSLHHALENATFIGPARTAPSYRFYSFHDVFPGLRPVTEGGFSVPGELYELTYETLRSELLPKEPAELELTIIELDDGIGSMCMKVRGGSIDADGVIDISDKGGWINHLEQSA